MRVLFLFLIVSCLTACSAYQPFDCPYKEGARCLSVGEIDQRINTGQREPGKMDCSSSKTKKLDILMDNHSPSPLRTAETVLKLWVAPYYSTDSAYYEGQFIHFVAREASWVSANPEINGEEL
jgi:hypothetical protein